MEAKTVLQYSARIELPNHLTADLACENFALLKESAQRMLNGGARFEPSTPAPGQTCQVFHPSYDTGRTAIGWIAAIEVPEHLSNKTVIERRLQAA